MKLFGYTCKYTKPNLTYTYTIKRIKCYKYAIACSFYGIRVYKRCYWCRTPKSEPGEHA